MEQELGFGGRRRGRRNGFWRVGFQLADRDRRRVVRRRRRKGGDMLRGLFASVMRLRRGRQIEMVKATAQRMSRFAEVTDSIKGSVPRFRNGNVCSSERRDTFRAGLMA